MVRGMEVCVEKPGRLVLFYESKRDFCMDRPRRAFVILGRNENREIAKQVMERFNDVVQILDMSSSEEEEKYAEIVRECRKAPIYVMLPPDA
jgi:hypothetical protein